MMTIEKDAFLQLLVTAAQAGMYPTDGKFYRVLCQCGARPSASGRISTEESTFDEATQYAEHLQARADADGNVARCVYFVQTLDGIEIYRTQSRLGAS